MHKIVSWLILFLIASCSSIPDELNKNVKNKRYRIEVDTVVARPSCTSWSEKYMLFKDQKKYWPNNCEPKKRMEIIPRGAHLKNVVIVKDFNLGQGTSWRIKAFVEGYEKYGLIEIPGCSYWHPESWMNCASLRKDPPILILNSKYISLVHHQGHN